MHTIPARCGDLLQANPQRGEIGIGLCAALSDLALLHDRLEKCSVYRSSTAPRKRVAFE
jgi:hypothetical protein